MMRRDEEANPTLPESQLGKPSSGCWDGEHSALPLHSRQGKFHPAGGCSSKQREAGMDMAQQRSPGESPAWVRPHLHSQLKSKAQEEEARLPALTLAAALPDLSAQAAARHGHVALLQAQVVLLFSKSRGNAGRKASAFDRHLRRKVGDAV